MYIPIRQMDPKDENLIFVQTKSYKSILIYELMLKQLILLIQNHWMMKLESTLWAQSQQTTSCKLVKAKPAPHSCQRQYLGQTGKYLK